MTGIEVAEFSAERDLLFLLAPGFLSSDGERQYCPECAELWGVLSYFPAIREALEIVYQPIDHPRPQLTSLLGAGDWNCPSLLLGEGADAGPDATVIEVNGRRLLDNARDIGKYFAWRYGTPFPR